MIPTPQEQRRSSFSKIHIKLDQVDGNDGDSQISVDAPMKCVSFCPQVNVRLVAPMAAMVAEPSELWFQEDEYILMRRSIMALAQKVGPNGTHMGNKYCIRGLEKHMDNGATFVLKKLIVNASLNCISH
ncbi:MAG: hypothetical protein SGARI_000082 [Bacillariaceae sp.]